MVKLRTLKGYEKLRHIFENSLTVELLAEEIKTCAPDENAKIVREEMEKYDFDLFGVLENGEIIGYVKKSELGQGKINEYYYTFSSEVLISDSTSVLQLLEILKRRDYVFILEKDSVTKIVTVADLHKQPIRMLTFSLISLLEMYLVEAIRELHPNEEWKEKLNETRLSKAKKTWELRKIKNEELTLLDNTQLSDKGIIVRNTPVLLEQMGFSSKSKCSDFFSNIEWLRNNTAHAQEIIYHDNKELIQVLLQINRILERIASDLRDASII